jgi:hypothetical protein
LPLITQNYKEDDNMKLESGTGLGLRGPGLGLSSASGLAMPPDQMNSTTSDSLFYIKPYQQLQAACAGALLTTLTSKYIPTL